VCQEIISSVRRASESATESDRYLLVPKSGTESDTCRVPKSGTELIPVGFRNLERSLIPVGSEIWNGV
jgi:hypothetical protein